MPRKVHNYDRSSTYRNDGEFECLWGSVGIVQCYKQGCVLAPTLFSIFLPAILDEAFRDMGVGVYMQSRQSADLFKTKTTRILMGELLFADDSALVAHSAEEMQKIVDAFSDASKKFGLKITIKKTEVLYQPNSTKISRGGYHGCWKQAELCSGNHLYRKH